jgi:hypothetical protein
MRAMARLPLHSTPFGYGMAKRTVVKAADRNDAEDRRQTGSPSFRRSGKPAGSIETIRASGRMTRSSALL